MSRGAGRRTGAAGEPGKANACVGSGRNAPDAATLPRGKARESNGSRAAVRMGLHPTVALSSRRAGGRVRPAPDQTVFLTYSPSAAWDSSSASMSWMP